MLALAGCLVYIFNAFNVVLFINRKLSYVVNMQVLNAVNDISSIGSMLWFPVFYCACTSFCVLVKELSRQFDVA